MESIWFKKPVDIETNVEFTERVLVIFFVFTVKQKV